jgi:hypothetical protein
MRSLALALLILAVGASAANAAPPYPGQVPVTDARSLAAIQVAVGYWRARGLTTCPNGIQAYMADSLMDVDGDARGRGGDCQAWLSGPQLQALYTDPRITDRRYPAEYECHDWTHEIGHALGLPHTYDKGVMDPSVTAFPAECVAWAVALYPAQHNPRSATRRATRARARARARARLRRS